MIGIVIFWLFPLPLAILAYIAILLVSGLLYRVIARAMKKGSKYGRDELWSAISRDESEPDETVKVLFANGLTLLVGKTSADQS